MLAWLCRRGIIRAMRTAAQVIEDALREEPDSDKRWEHVTTLHRRNDEDAFHTAVALLDSDEPQRRELAADILAQLGAGKDARPYARPAAELLIQRIEHETHPEVLQAMATAFQHLGDARCIPVLHSLRDHPSEDVRYGVVFGLLGHEDDLAVQALIELSRDPDEDVRDWATFGLGAQIERDDAQVRDALVARLEDPHDDTRAEAISGLAVRGDERAIPSLLAELDDSTDLDDLSTLEGEALLALAVRTGDQRLCQHVHLLRQAWADKSPTEPMPDELRDAIEACGRVDSGIDATH
jgi:HEAT repeat protein